MLVVQLENVYRTILTTVAAQCQPCLGCSVNLWVCVCVTMRWATLSKAPWLPVLKAVNWKAIKAVVSMVGLPWKKCAFFQHREKRWLSAYSQSLHPTPCHQQLWEEVMALWWPSFTLPTSRGGGSGRLLLAPFSSYYIENTFQTALPKDCQNAIKLKNPFLVNPNTLNQGAILLLRKKNSEMQQLVLNL